MGSFSSRGRRVAEPIAGREEATRPQHLPAHGHSAAMRGDGIEEDAGRCKEGMQSRQCDAGHDDMARCRVMRGDTQPAAAIRGGAVHRDGMQGNEMQGNEMQGNAHQCHAGQHNAGR